MKLTQEDDYALRVVLFLYRYGQDRRIEAKMIAEHENVPLRFLLKLLRKLAVAGVVKSYMGYGGGYAVEKPPERVNLLEVIEAIEGPLAVTKCLEDVSGCNLGRAGSCEIHRALGGVQQRLAEDLRTITFQNLLKEFPPCAPDAQV